MTWKNFHYENIFNAICKRFLIKERKKIKILTIFTMTKHKKNRLKIILWIFMSCTFNFYASNWDLHDSTVDYMKKNIEMLLLTKAMRRDKNCKINEMITHIIVIMWSIYGSRFCHIKTFFYNSCWMRVISFSDKFSLIQKEAKSRKDFYDIHMHFNK